MRLGKAFKLHNIATASELNKNMTDAEDSGTQETAEKSESAADESPERSERSYRDNSISEDTAYESGKAQGEISYRNASKKIAAKKTGRMGGLEKAVSESSAKAEMDNAGYMSPKLVLSLAERVEAAHSADSDDENDTQNGAVAIIYHRDKGELEFLVEEKPLDYYFPKARGKLSLIGGSIQKGETSLDALARELSEEIKEPLASTLIKSLNTKSSFYQRLTFEYKGTKGYIDIYLIEVEQDSIWNIAGPSFSQQDAGFLRVLKQNELRVDDFAFGYGEIVKRFADYNSKFGSKKLPHSLHTGNQYLASSLLPSLDSPNIPWLGWIQPRNFCP